MYISTLYSTKLLQCLFYTYKNCTLTLNSRDTGFSTSGRIVLVYYHYRLRPIFKYLCKLI